MGTVASEQVSGKNHNYVRVQGVGFLKNTSRKYGCITPSLRGKTEPTPPGYFHDHHPPHALRAQTGSTVAALTYEAIPMRDAISAIFAVIISICKGTESFANAYGELGQVAHSSAKNFREEEDIRSKQRRAELQAKLNAPAQE